MANEIAKTILEQLGGNRFVVMTGSKNFLGRPDGLSFKVGSNAKRVTHVRATLTPLDLYDVEFLNIRGTKISNFTPAIGVYADQLCKIFTDATGLRTSF